MASLECFVTCFTLRAGGPRLAGKTAGAPKAVVPTPGRGVISFVQLLLSVSYTAGWMGLKRCWLTQCTAALLYYIWSIQSAIPAVLYSPDREATEAALCAV